MNSDILVCKVGIYRCFDFYICFSGLISLILIFVLCFRTRFGICIRVRPRVIIILLSNKDVSQAWKELTYVLVGESMADNKSILPLINGITISPKKNFCIVKIWLASCEFRDSSVIKELHGISSHGCLFKEHMPEY